MLLYQTKDNLPLFVLYRGTFNESKVRYIFARKLKIQYASFTDKRNELIKFIYILSFSKRWIGVKNNNNNNNKQTS